MNTWVLIIVLYSGIGQAPDTSVTITDFSSQQKCIVAGRQTMQVLSNNSTLLGVYSCVQR